MTSRLFLLAIPLCSLAAAAGYLGHRMTSEDAAGTESAASAAEPTITVTKLICTGIVESVGGEVDVCAQVTGRLLEVQVTEGDRVEKGQVLALIDDRRAEARVAVAEAQVEVARSELRRIEAGAGQEERQEALAAVQAEEALLEYELSNFARLQSLHEQNSSSLSDLQRSKQQVEHYRSRVQSLQKRYEALQRGPIPEEIAAARAEVGLAEQRLREAQVDREYCTVKSPITARVVQVHLHTGDSVSVEEITPILRLVDTDRLRLRLEIDEADVARLQPPMEGMFYVPAVPDAVGSLTIRTIVPQFGPKRLFNPDTSARLDTRTINVLCEITSSEFPLYPGQRITAEIALTDSADD
jgi:multidrug resistance efflux pump